MTAATTVRIPALDARRRWFGLDAVVTGLNALGYLTLGAWLSEQFGSASSMYRIIGVALLVFAIVVGVDAIGRPPRWIGWSIVSVNAAWVVGWLLVAVAGLGDFNGMGRAWIAIQAAVVGALTVMQTSTLRNR